MASSLTDTTPTHALRRLETELRLSTPELAVALGVTARTLDRWRLGTSYPQRDARGRLESLLALSDALREMFSTPDAARDWFHRENRYLGQMSPADAVRAGRADRAHAALEALESGIFI
jgi:uncharacterized protein (DUF2384 family)